MAPREKREDGAMAWLRERISGGRKAGADRRLTDLVARLRAGDEEAFAELIDRYGASMLRVARLHVRDRAVAEEVVQETWLAVLNGIERFEGRSSLKTWLFRILSNRAKTRGEREGRSVPFSAIAATDAAADGEAVGRRGPLPGRRRPPVAVSLVGAAPCLDSGEGARAGEPSASSRTRSPTFPTPSAR